MRISQIGTCIVGAVFSLILMGAFGSGAVAQDNTARWGGDYQYKIVGNARQCDRLCANDSRCRAWQFLKIIKQCRLKYMVPKSISSACCVSGVKGDRRFGAGSSGRKRARCDEYALRAIDMSNGNLEKRCGFRGQNWHVNYDRHFNFCMDNRGRDWRAVEDRRKVKLEQCERQFGARRGARCDHLARLAVQQGKTNRENGCGFDAPYWNASRDRHLRMCRDDGADQGRQTLYSQDRFEKRERRLRRCMLRGGGARDKACDDFTKGAISRYQQSLKYRCRYSDSIWNDNYDLQYNWCRKVSVAERAKRLDLMRYQIKRCKKRRGWRKIFKF